MATKIISVLEASKKTLAQNSHGLRVACGEMGICLMSIGSYVASSVNGAGLALTLACDRSALSFESAKRVCIVSGNKGALARFVEVSTCGNFVRIGVDILHTSTLAMQVLTLAEFASICLEKGDRFSIMGRDKRTFDGFCFSEGFKGGWANRVYAVCAYALEGKLQFRDIETRENIYNKVAGEAGSVLCTFNGSRTQVDVEDTLRALLDTDCTDVDNSEAETLSATKAATKKALANARRKAARDKAKAAKKAQG